MKVMLLAVLFVFTLSACVGPPRYSDDPKAAGIQALTDFCIVYGTLRDTATNFIAVDAVRAEPVLSVGMVEGYASARQFIRPFCSPSFDPQSEAFDLDNLEKELLKIRLVLLKKEQS